MEAKSQHFLLSKQARALSLKRIIRLSDEEAFAEFVAIRFADTDGRPTCPYCNDPSLVPYFLTTRQKWKCSHKSCRRQFSATTGTPFASRKMSFVDILTIMVYFVKEPKGLRAIHLLRNMGFAYKTAFVVLHKLREAIGIEQHRHILRGEIETDGAYFGGHVRPKNSKPARVDRRRLPHKSDKQQCVSIMRERGGRSRAFVCSEAEAARLIPSVVAPGSIIYADDSPVYNRLHAHYIVRRINHQERYSENGTSTNWAESNFARLRRSEIGSYHHIAGPYLDHYANEMSWREDNRRRTDHEKFDEVGRLMTRGGVSRKWKGYWQRRRVAE